MRYFSSRMPSASFHSRLLYPSSFISTSGISSVKERFSFLFRISLHLLIRILVIQVRKYLSSLSRSIFSQQVRMVSEMASAASSSLESRERAALYIFCIWDCISSVNASASRSCAFFIRSFISGSFLPHVRFHMFFMFLLIRQEVCRKCFKLFDIL